MNPVEIILSIGGLITALGVIITAIVTAYKFLRREEEWRKEKDAHDNENYLAILRLTIINESMPLTERIKAGDIYVQKGGNGMVKKKYHELLNEYSKQHQEF